MNSARRSKPTILDDQAIEALISGAAAGRIIQADKGRVPVLESVDLVLGSLLLDDGSNRVVLAGVVALA